MIFRKDYLRLALVVVAFVVISGMLDAVFGPSPYESRPIDMGSGWVR